MEDYKGMKIDKITVGNFVRNINRYGHSGYECICGCGRNIVRTKTQLRQAILHGKYTTCQACSRQKDANNPRWAGHGEIGRWKWTSIQRHCVRKNKVVPFTLTIEQAWERFLKQDRRCALSGVPLTMIRRNKSSGSYQMTGNASLDRIDSNRGYEPDNIQWIDKRLQPIKKNMPQHEFIALCTLVATHNA